MAEILLHPDPQSAFPPGTQVRIYKQIEGAPRGFSYAGQPIVAEPTVDEGGALTVTGLEAGVMYLAQATIEGVIRTLRFRTPDASAVAPAGEVAAEATQVFHVKGPVTLPELVVVQIPELILEVAEPTITLPKPVSGRSCQPVTVQDATGGRKPLWRNPAEGGTIRWLDNTTPAATPTANARDEWAFWVGVGSLDYQGMRVGRFGA